MNLAFKLRLLGRRDGVSGSGAKEKRLGDWLGRTTETSVASGSGL